MNAKKVHYEQQEKITNIKILNNDIAVLSRIGDWGKEKNVHPYIHACVYFLCCFPEYQSSWKIEK